MIPWIAHNPIAEMVALPIVALLLAGMIGAQRERAGKSAGLRTHMLVALGAAVLVIACRHSGMSHADVSRVVQGIAAGVGFIGGGAILKLSTVSLIDPIAMSADDENGMPRNTLLSSSRGTKPGYMASGLRNK